MLSDESVISSPTHPASLGWYVISSGVSQQWDTGLWKTTLVSGSTAYWKNSAGLPERSLICAQAKGTMEICQDCANEAGISFSLIITPLPHCTQNMSGNTDSCQVRGRDAKAALTVGVIRKRQGDED